MRQDSSVVEPTAVLNHQSKGGDGLEHREHCSRDAGSNPAAAITLATHHGFALIEAADAPFLYRAVTDSV